MEEAAEEEEIEKEDSEEDGNRETYLPPKAAEFFSVSDNFDRHVSGGRYLYGAVILARWQRPMDGGTGTQNLSEWTRNR